MTVLGTFRNRELNPLIQGDLMVATADKVTSFRVGNEYTVGRLPTITKDPLVVRQLAADADPVHAGRRADHRAGGVLDAEPDRRSAAGWTAGAVRRRRGDGAVDAAARSP